LENVARDESLSQKDEEAGGGVVQSEEPDQRRPFPERVSSLNLEHEVQERCTD
jgi:hypothetical protein